ncbi:MAG: helix-turn-helix domain-containing protein [Oscillospiraceae bacterium]|nr:helix-turn-helix domain-containing protein [Oscillospiraceae bacterium]
MHNRKYYENKFKPYPDVVTKKQLIDMLDICENTAQSLLQKEKIRHFRIGNRYQIPKVCVIDFLVGDDYNPYTRNRSKAHHEITSDEVERGKEKILLLCAQPRTRKELMYMLDVPSKKTFFRLFLNPLLESGELQMTIPNQRSVSTQRYVRV